MLMIVPRKATETHSGSSSSRMNHEQKINGKMNIFRLSDRNLGHSSSSFETNFNLFIVHCKLSVLVHHYSSHVPPLSLFSFDMLNMQIVKKRKSVLSILLHAFLIGHCLYKVKSSSFWLFPHTFNNFFFFLVDERTAATD